MEKILFERYQNNTPIGVDYLTKKYIYIYIYRFSFQEAPLQKKCFKCIPSLLSGKFRKECKYFFKVLPKCIILFCNWNYNLFSTHGILLNFSCSHAASHYYLVDNCQRMTTMWVKCVPGVCRLIGWKTTCILGYSYGQDYTVCLLLFSDV